MQSQLTPYANGSMIGNNPALQAQLAQIANDTTNQVNSAVRRGRPRIFGANQQALARGIAQGEAPVIAGQYNQDVANQLNAANSLYGAQNTTSGILSGLKSAGVSPISGRASRHRRMRSMRRTIRRSSNWHWPNWRRAFRRRISAAGADRRSDRGAGSAKQRHHAGHATNVRRATVRRDRARHRQSFQGSRLPIDGLKEDIEPVGTLFDGTPVYGYRYKGAGAYHIGLMAQDVEKTNPDAVIEINGYKAVDYRAATEASRKIAVA